VAAIAYPEFQPGRIQRRPELRVLPPVEVVLRRSERSSMAAVYRRRRIAALVVGLVAISGVVLLANVAVTQLTAGAVTPPPVATAPEIVVVQPGDTLWSIAVAQGGEGDVRERVDALVRANGGSSALQVGDRIVLPD
jgi:hypothetical protein